MRCGCVLHEAWRASSCRFDGGGSTQQPGTAVTHLHVVWAVGPGRQRLGQQVQHLRCQGLKVAAVVWRHVERAYVVAGRQQLWQLRRDGLPRAVRACVVRVASTSSRSQPHTCVSIGSECGTQPSSRTHRAGRRAAAACLRRAPAQGAAAGCQRATAVTPTRPQASATYACCMATHAAAAAVWATQ
jgi:hypothetical protein